MAKDKNILFSIDVGTQSVRALAFDKKGKIIDSERVIYKPAYYSPKPGWAEQNPEYYWEKLGEACRNLFKKGNIDPNLIAGAAITSQRGTVVNLDADGKPLRDAILWLDQRRANKLPKLKLPWNLVFKIPGLRKILRYFQAEAEANWIRENQSEIWEKTKHFLLLSGYLSYKITNKFVDSTGCQVGYLPFDYRKQEWAKNSSWKMNAVPVKHKALPELIQPGDQLGVVTAGASEFTGLPEGLPVIAAASDKACETIGSGCIDLWQGCIGFGTTATINVNSSKYIEPVFFLPAYPSAKKGSFNLEVQIFRGFWMVTWFKEQFAQIEQKAADEEGIAPEVLLERLASKVPDGSMGLVLQPYWSPGIKFPGIEAKGGIIGFGGVHKKEHIYRAILEGLAYALREGKERIERKTKTKITELYVSGGGSKSDLMMQITANVFGMSVIRPSVYETSGLGAAILTAAGTGVYQNLETAVNEMTSKGKTFNPQLESVKKYNRLYNEVYKKMYGKLQPLYKSIMNITRYPESV